MCAFVNFCGEEGSGLGNPLFYPLMRVRACALLKLLFPFKPYNPFDFIFVVIFFLLFIVFPGG
jgi:hypothetical protein